MLELGNTVLKWLSALAPAAIVIISIILVASIIKGYTTFINGVKTILESKWAFLFFIIVVCLGLYFWNEFKVIAGI